MTSKKQMPVKILDLEFNLLGEIEDYESLNFIRGYNSIGSFELKVNKNKPNVQYLKRDNIVYLQNDKCGIILYREVKTGTNGSSSEVVTIKGYDMLGLLKKRIVMPPDGVTNWTFKGNVEAGLKQLVNDCMGSSASEKRKIGFVGVAEQHGIGEEVEIASRYDSLDEKIIEVAKDNDLGIKFVLDYENKKFNFDIYRGIKRISSQSEIPPVVFSVDFGNISEETLTDSRIDYKNYALVAGQGEGVDREIKEVVKDMYEVENLITNGSFENDLTGWRIAGSLASSAGTTAEQKRFGEKSYKGLFNKISQDNILWHESIDTSKIISGHKYCLIKYAKGDLYGSSAPIIFTHCVLNGTNVGGDTRLMNDEWTKTVSIGVAGDNTENNYFATGWTQEILDSDARYFYLDGYTLIDLTEAFGEGNEPDEAWVMENIDYFEGKTFVSENFKKGYELDELFVDARDIGTESTTTLEQRGVEKLNEVAAIYTLEGKVIPYNTFSLEKDYFLGDTVSVKFYDVDEVVTMDTPITEVKEYWSSTGYSAEITFGNQIPNLVTKMKQAIKGSIFKN